MYHRRSGQCSCKASRTTQLILDLEHGLQARGKCGGPDGNQLATGYDQRHLTMYSPITVRIDPVVKKIALKALGGRLPLGVNYS